MTDPADFKAPFEMYPYLSVMENRSPEQKLHSNLGHAKNAIGQGGGYDYRNDKYVRMARGGQIYEWDPIHNEWKLLYDVPARTPVSELPWK